MTTHKYSVGQEVRYWPERYESGLRGEPHVVTRLLPELDGVPQYRIVAKAGGVERVTCESQILSYAPLRAV